MRIFKGVACAEDASLLSLERCKALLSSEGILSDADVTRLRDGLYALAGLIVDSFLEVRLDRTTTLAVSSEN